MVSPSDRKLIFTVAVGEKYSKLAQLTHPLLQKYAKRCGADFHVVNRIRPTRPPHFGKLVAERLLMKYDRIMYVDTDVIIRATCPDCFNVVPKGFFGAVEEHSWGRNWEKEAPNIFKTLGLYDAPIRQYNSGVMVFDRSHREVFRECLRAARRLGWRCASYYDQPYFNYAFLRLGTKMFDLDGRFNYFPALWKVKMDEAYIVHAIENKSEEFVRNQVANAGW